MILVTGGTGTVGSEVVKQLTASGTRFRVLVRDQKKAPRHPNVEVVSGELGNQAVLSKMFEGIDKLFLHTHSFPGSSELHKQVVDAAAKAKVRHTVRISIQGATASSPIAHARWHASADSYLQSSAVKWTLLRPTSFIQNFLGSAATIKRDGAFYGSAGHGKVPFVDARDVAAAAVKALSGDGHEGQVYNLTGKEPLSHAEIAIRLSRLLGKTVKYVDLPAEQFKAGTLGGGIPEWLAKDWVQLHLTTAAGQTKDVDPTLGRLIGKVRTLDEFLLDYKSAFQ